MHCSRRDLVKRLAWMGLILSTSGGASLFFEKRRSRAPRLAAFRDHRLGLHLPDGIAVVHGQAIPAMVERVLAPFGGMEGLIRPGETLLLKPNAAWDRSPEQAADTHPEIVGTLVRLARKAGAKRVVVADVACNDPGKSWAHSGIRAAAEGEGGEVVTPRDFVEVDYSGGAVGRFLTGEIFLKADRIINLPIVKDHSLTRVTIGMKNWYGLLGGRRHKLHQVIDNSIVELSLAVKPTFTLVDATRILTANGPQGGSLAHVKNLGLIAAGSDQVALDTWGASLLNLTPAEVHYLPLAKAKGLGTTDYKSKIIERVNLEA